MAKSSLSQQRAKVINNPSLERDLRSSAVINSDTSAYQHRMAHKRAHANQQADIKNLQDQVAKLTELVRALTSK